MLGAAPELTRTIGTVEVDAAVGRQASAAIQILRGRRTAGQLGTAVIVDLGNNGTLTAKQFDEMMALLGEVRRVVVVNVRVPRPWAQANNDVLAEGVKRYPNAVLVDWAAASGGHPEYFWKDGVHLRPAGMEVYARLIADALNAP